MNKTITIKPAPVIFHLEVPIPKRGNINGANLSFHATFPFIPQIGMYLVVIPGDDHRKVEDLYWSEDTGFEVFFEFDERAKIKELLKLGWQEDK